jgi:hypothetical protein
VVVVDPVDGRETLAPGDRFTSVPDGPVVVPAVQGGRCVLSAFDGADPAWTRVLGPCGSGAPRVEDGGVRTLAVRWADSTASVDLGTGRREPTAASGVTAAGAEVGRSADLVVLRERHATPANPLRWGSPTTVLAVVDARTGRPVAQVASAGRLDLLLLDGDGLVVRTDEGIVRHTIRGR